jgi:hypothetical protein
MVAAAVLGGPPRCEVLGLRMEDLRVAERRVFIADGKGGHQGLIPVSARFFAVVAALSVRGLDEILAGARRRAGLSRATCHELRHTKPHRRLAEPRTSVDQEQVQQWPRGCLLFRTTGNSPAKMSKITYISSMSAVQHRNPR